MRRPNYRTDRTSRTASPPLSPRSTASTSSISTSTTTANLIDAQLLLGLRANGSGTPPATLHWDLRSFLDAGEPSTTSVEYTRPRRPTNIDPASTASSARVVPPMARRRRRQPPMVPEWVMDPISWMQEEELPAERWPEARQMSVKQVAEYNRKAVREDREENERLRKQKEGKRGFPPAVEFSRGI